MLGRVAGAVGESWEIRRVPRDVNVIVLPKPGGVNRAGAPQFNEGIQHGFVF